MQKLKISAVSYLNTKPFLWGIEQLQKQTPPPIPFKIELDIPAQTAQKLLQNTVQIALVPVAILPQLPNYKIITNYCIGAINQVKTVCLYSQKPLQQLTHIFLDYHSRTSVQLVQILCKHFWKKNVQFIESQPNFETQIQDTTGGVIIGDRTIYYHQQFKYCYDLAEAWHQFTQLPFVFAAWVTTQNIPQNVIDYLNTAFDYATQNLPAIAQQYQKNYPQQFDVYQYLTQNIDYKLDTQKTKALNLFLNYISPNQLVTIN